MASSGPPWPGAFAPREQRQRFWITYCRNTAAIGYSVNGYEYRLRIGASELRDSTALEGLLNGKDIIFNLAGQTSHLESMHDPETDLAINVIAQLRLLEACRKRAPKVRLVYASTRQLYGRPLMLPVDESHPIDPVDVNGINKLSAEMYHLLYAKVYDLSACVLRLTNTIGPRMRIRDARQTFVGIWVRQLLEGRPIEVWGEGENSCAISTTSRTWLMLCSWPQSIETYLPFPLILAPMK